MARSSLAKDLAALGVLLEHSAVTPCETPATWVVRDRVVRDLLGYDPVSKDILRLLGLFVDSLGKDIKLAPAWNVFAAGVECNPSARQAFGQLITVHEQAVDQYLTELLGQAEPEIDLTRAPGGLLYAVCLRYLDSAKRNSPGAKRARGIRDAIKRAMPRGGRQH